MIIVTGKIKLINFIISMNNVTEIILMISVTFLLRMVLKLIGYDNTGTVKLYLVRLLVKLLFGNYFVYVKLIRLLR